MHILMIQYVIFWWKFVSSTIVEYVIIPMSHPKHNKLVRVLNGYIESSSSLNMVSIDKGNLISNNNTGVKNKTIYKKY